LDPVFIRGVVRTKIIHQVKLDEEVDLFGFGSKKIDSRNSQVGRNSALFQQDIAKA
jgi:nucleoid DNA-binding protein